MATYVPFRAAGEVDAAPTQRKSTPFSVLQFAGSVGLFAGLTGAAAGLLDVANHDGQMITVVLWTVVAGTGGIIAAIGAVGGRILSELRKPI